MSERVNGQASGLVLTVLGCSKPTCDDLTEGKKKLDLVRHSVLSLVLRGKRVPLRLLHARYLF